MLHTVANVLIYSLLAAAPAVATVSQSDPDLCELAAQKAARNSVVPLELLLAISQVETGRNVQGSMRPWPWAINQSGKGFWFDDENQAIAFAKDLLAQGETNFDVGCFQINLHWHSKNFTSIEDIFDPETNAVYAAKFLTELFHSEGGWPEAVAAYHSRSPDEAQAYLAKVETALIDLRQQSVIAQVPDEINAIAAQLAPRENHFPLLLSGTRGSGASLVPITDGVGPLFAATP